MQPHKLSELSDPLKKLFIPQSNINISSETMALKPSKMNIVKLPDQIRPPPLITKLEVISKSRSPFEPEIYN
jgi:hypothetical protein